MELDRTIVYDFGTASQEAIANQQMQETQAGEEAEAQVEWDEGMKRLLEGLEGGQGAGETWEGDMWEGVSGISEAGNPLEGLFWGQEGQWVV